MRTGILCLAMFFLASAVHAAADSPEELIRQGVEAYVKADANEALKVWLKGSALEGDRAVLMQASALAQVSALYGKAVSYDMISRHDITDRLSNILIVLNFENGPMFGVFQMYRNERGQWITSMFKVHTDGPLVWPAQALYPE